MVSHSIAHPSDGLGAVEVACVDIIENRLPARVHIVEHMNGSRQVAVTIRTHF